MAVLSDQLELVALRRDTVLMLDYDPIAGARMTIMAGDPASGHSEGEVAQLLEPMRCPPSMHHHRQFRLCRIADDTDKLSKHGRAGSSPPACSDMRNLEVDAQRVQHAPNHAPRPAEGSDGEAKLLCAEF